MKNSTKVYALLAVVLCATIAAAHYSMNNKSTRDFTGTTHPEPPREILPISNSPRIEALISDRKIAASSVNPEIGKTFSISRTGPMRPPGDALKRATNLLQAAQSGDAVASYEIFLTTLDCDNRLRSAGAMYQEMNNGKSTVRPDDTTEEDRKNLMDCEGLLTSDSFQNHNWLKQAAEQGSIEAMIMYSINADHVLGNPNEYAMKPELVQQWKDDSVNYLRKAASLGSIDALYSLSNVYENGIIAPADPVEAYAYRMAAIKFMRTPSNLRSQLQPSEELTPSQVRLAQARRNNIISSCCSN